jgi:hypothetical protein
LPILIGREGSPAKTSSPDAKRISRGLARDPLRAESVHTFQPRLPFVAALAVTDRLLFAGSPI